MATAELSPYPTLSTMTADRERNEDLPQPPRIGIATKQPFPPEAHQTFLGDREYQTLFGLNNRRRASELCDGVPVVRCHTLSPAVTHSQLYCSGLLPHRYPMDFLREIHADPHQRSIVATIRFYDTNCQGHFPGYPVVPGGLQADAIAQLLASFTLLAAQEKRITPQYAQKAWAELRVMLKHISHLEFQNEVRPGDTVTGYLTWSRPAKRNSIRQTGYGFLINERLRSDSSSGIVASLKVSGVAVFPGCKRPLSF